ncbi:unnamed protein product, partial [Vitis vinifera]
MWRQCNQQLSPVSLTDIKERQIYTNTSCIVEMVEKILQLFSMAIYDTDGQNMNIVLKAVENRRSHIYDFLLNSNLPHREIAFHAVDEQGNSALHLAGKLPGYRHFQHIPTSMLHMQWEVKWFKVCSCFFVDTCLGSSRIRKLKEKKEMHVWSLQIMDKLLEHAARRTDEINPNYDWSIGLSLVAGTVHCIYWKSSRLPPLPTYPHQHVAKAVGSQVVPVCAEFLATRFWGRHTPDEIFQKEHQKLEDESKQWLNSTSNSCSFIAALITTVAFASSASVPGGRGKARHWGISF